MKKVPLLLVLLLFINFITYSQNSKPINLWSSSKSLCETDEITLMASSDSLVLFYEWYKGIQSIGTTKNPSLKVTAEGVYHVVAKYENQTIESSRIELTKNCIEKPLISTDSKSIDLQRASELSIFEKFKETSETNSPNGTMLLPQLTCANPVVCGSNTAASLVVTNQDPAYSYVWQISSSENGTYTAISGATGGTLTTSAVGYYRVLVSDGSTTLTLSPIYVSTRPYAHLTDINDAFYTSKNVAVGQTVPIKFKFFGNAPWTLYYNDGSGDLKSILVLSSPYTLNYTVDQNRYISIAYITNACGSSSGGNKGSMIINADSNTGITLQTPASTSTCPGGTISVPYSTNGTWTTQRSIGIEMQDANGNYVSNSYRSGYFTNPMVYQVPSSVGAGTYKLRVYLNLPFQSGVTISSYSINVSGSGCTPDAFITSNNSNQSCVGSNLVAYPCCSGYSYQWYKDGNIINGATFSGYYANQNANYSVRVTNTSGYNSLSADVPISITGFVAKITATNPILCGTNTSTTLIATPNGGAGYIYQWNIYNSTSGIFEPIIGANSSTYTTSVVGRYTVYVGTGICSSTSSSFSVSTGPISYLTDLNDNLFPSIYTTPNTAVPVKLQLYGQAPWTFIIADGTNTKTVTTSTSPYFFDVTPEMNRYYYISYLAHSCTNPSNLYITNGQINTYVDNNTAFNFSSTGTIDACAGGTIDIPYTTSGTWTNERRISLEMVDTNGNFISNLNSFIGGYFSNPMTYQIPSNIPIGSYKIRAYASLPNTTVSVLSPFTINVNNTGCTPSAIFTANPSNVTCNGSSLTARPCCGSTTYTYEWYKDGIVIPNATSSNYYATQTANYSVRVMNAASGYNSLSSQQPISVTGFTANITSSNPVICGSNTAATLQANSTASNPTYQWLFSTNNGNYSLISGATSQTYTTSQVGFYKVIVSSSTCEATSNSFQVSSIPVATLTTMNDVTFTTIFSSPGQPVQLKINLSGAAPWVVTYFDGILFRTTNVTSSPHIITVYPEQNRQYSLSTVSSSCGTSSGNGYVIVNVDNSTSLTMPTPSTTNVCAGGSIDIPYNTVGTWSTSRSIVAALYDTNGNYITSVGGLSSNPIRLNLPSNLPLNGTYKVRLSPTIPYMSTFVTSSYTLTVTSTGCSQSAYINQSSMDGCTNPYFFASPYFPGNTYQWYLNGNLISNEVSSSLRATQSGNYSVMITNASNGYSSTSLEYPAIVNMQSITVSSSGSLCNTNTPVTFSTSPQTGGNTYEWYYSQNGSSFSLLSTETSSSLSTQNSGVYYAVISNGACQQRTSNLRTCSFLINSTTLNVCQLASVNVSISTVTFNSSSTYTLQLLDANTGNVVEPNLTTFVGSQFSNNGSYTLSINLPASVGAGTYKFKLLASEVFGGIIGNQILTVNSTSAVSPPTLSYSPTTITNFGQSVVLTANGCSGSVVWSNGITATTQTVTLNSSTTYTASCYTTSCSSPNSSITIPIACDTNEPNNTFNTSVLVTQNSFTSSTLCLDSGQDLDWFSFVINGKVYYIKVRLFSGAQAGSYKFSLIYSAGVLTLQTLPSTVGQSLDTVVELFDSNGQSFISSNDDSGGNGFSLLNYTVPNQCPSQILLTSTLFDILEGQTSNPKATTIIASNKVNNNTLTNYRGQSSVLLIPGFETKIASTGKFVVEIKGCNDN